MREEIVNGFIIKEFNPPDETRVNKFISEINHYFEKKYSTKEKTKNKNFSKNIISDLKENVK